MVEAVTRRRNRRGIGPTWCKRRHGVLCCPGGNEGPEGVLKSLSVTARDMGSASTTSVPKAVIERDASVQQLWRC